MYDFMAVFSLLFYIYIITSLLFSPVMWPLGVLCWLILIGGVFLGVKDA